MKWNQNRFTAMGLALCAALGLSGTALAYTPPGCHHRLRTHRQSHRHQV